MGDSCKKIPIRLIVSERLRKALFSIPVFADYTYVKGSEIVEMKKIDEETIIVLGVEKRWCNDAEIRA